MTIIGFIKSILASDVFAAVAAVVLIGGAMYCIYCMASGKSLDD